LAHKRAHKSRLAWRDACAAKSMFVADGSAADTQYAIGCGRPTPQYKNPFRATSSGE
jgi:hypothetical protein